MIPMSSSQPTLPSALYIRDRNSNTKDIRIPGRTPVPTHRHAAPSGPWPWIDFDSDSNVLPPIPEEVDGTWKGYPQNLFGNWTPDKVDRSKMLRSCSQGTSNIFRVDVLDGGLFDDDVVRGTISVSADNIDEILEQNVVPRPQNVRTRAIFVDNMIEEVLKMLGTKYRIEPFFFSSSMNWIPSRYQEEVKKGEGDHITIVLPFIRTVHNRGTRWSTALSSSSVTFPPASQTLTSDANHQIIDTQASLLLRSGNCLLVQDLLAVHMIRNTTTNTVISYHPNSRTPAKRLHSLVHRTGQSVYWSKIFQRSRDPTFLLLTFLWYALYSWDESLEALYKHITWLEARVLHTSDIHLTRELHILQAHLLHYESLLKSFQKSVTFVQETPNPAMDDTDVDEQERKQSAKILRGEAEHLLGEIERLEGQRELQIKRLRNVMDLAFASVNIDDSRYTKRLSEATLRDSAAMKQISYLTMVFFPASFISSVFGMNVREFVGQPGVYYPATLPKYFAVTLSLSCFTTWLLISLQTYSSFHPLGCSRLRRFGWPIFFVLEKFAGTKASKKSV